MINQRITKLRQLMKERGIDLYIIPTSDFHQSEYVGSYFEARHYMSGFSGSAGTLIVREDEAYLWTDGRYFIKAEKELADSCIQLMKMRTPGVPTIKEYIEKYPEATIGFDGRVMPYNQCLFTNTIQANEDLVDLIWQERPELSHEEIYLYDTKYCGVSRKEKLEIIREKMKDAKYHLVTTLDDIAWIFNIRGNDVLCNPVALAYALIEKEKANLYLRKEAVSQEVIDELLKDQIEVKDYFDIYEDIKHIEGKVLLDTKSVNYALVSHIRQENIIDQTNPSQLLKSIKNETEIKATKDAHLHDGIAVTKFMYWLKTNIGKMEMDELSISNKLLEYRKQQPNFKDISFTTICAYHENAALMHYHPTEKQYSKVNASHLLLIDSGGQYLTGTTDITRTFVLGEMTQEERKDFTIALKAMFRLQNAHFIQDVTTGANLDILARGVIYDYDLDYRCGTGHGVGHFLNVHEGPNGLRPKSLYGHEACIVPGMITTDEPGVYVEGSHGIRHENELLCVKHTENEYGTFLKFEPITYVPFDIEGLDLNYLSNHEIASINEYQQYAFDHIKDALTQEEKDWYLNNLFIK